MNIFVQLKNELSISLAQVEATVKLIDEGNTIPFIARYRKEVTGSLNDEVLRNLDERLTYLRNLEEKKKTVISSIEEQGKLTEELKNAIEAAMTMVVVEDLYRPYRPKRRTRATIAKEKGLLPLAELIAAEELTVEALVAAAEYVTEAKEEALSVKTPEEALALALDIIAEQISDDADHRRYIREITMEEGSISSTAKNPKEQSVYEMYYEFEEKLTTLPGHRILALNRGETEKLLIVKVNAPTERILTYLEKKLIVKQNPFCEDSLRAVAADAYERLIAPAIEREIRNDLTERAEDGAIKVFGKNLVQLLMQPPITGKNVLGWDPAFRTGCKLAVVDATGKVLDTVVVYPTAPQNKVDEAKRIVKRLIEKYDISLISVGNGTASRESEMIIVELLRELNRPVQYVIVNEAGASVYSASKLATEEFPNFDVGQRSAASIARRLQDPLAELVKIDPKSIGVGQYQHDMNQKKLSEVLSGVVEDCVNKVGVDLNTASAPLLEYVSGISKPIAKNIVAYREENGRFKERKELLKVAKLGPKAYEQCAGFLRIIDGKNPLDATSVHPESYEAAEKLLAKLGYTTADIKAVQARQRELVNRAERAEKRAPEPRRSRDDRLVIRGGDTTMAQALMAAMNGGGLSALSEKDRSSRRGRDERQPSLGNAGANDNGANTAGLSGLSHQIKNKKELAAELSIGEITLMDIVKELEKPGRDPREEMPKPILRTDVLEMKDLTEGMILKGTVRNVIDFGAFVDIGVHQDGLVHVSQMSDKRFIKHPLEAVSVGDIVDVKVLSVDLQKKRIQLTMIL